VTSRFGSFNAACSFAIGAAFIATALNACGPAESNDPIASGRDRLRANDFRGAAESFEQALALEPASSARMPQLRLFYAQAVAHFDAERALRDTTDLIESTPVKDADLAEVASALRESRKYEQALALLVASVATHPKSDRLDFEYNATMQAAAAEAQKQADGDALNRLKGLGYVGGDSGAPIPRPQPRIEQAEDADAAGADASPAGGDATTPER